MSSSGSPAFTDLSHPSIFRMPSAASILAGMISLRLWTVRTRSPLAVVMRHSGFLDALAEAIVSAQRAGAAFQAIAIEVEQLLATPSAFSLVLGLDFFHARKDTRIIRYAPVYNTARRHIQACR